MSLKVWSYRPRFAGYQLQLLIMIHFYLMYESPVLGSATYVLHVILSESSAFSIHHV